MAYTIKTLTPLARSQKMLELNMKRGSINITDNYFDFHQSLNAPKWNSKKDIFNKVMDDKLME
jgi:hypothetical protein